MEAPALKQIDVNKLLSYVDKYVQIKLFNRNLEIFGIVYTIDLVTENVIVLKKENEKLGLSIVMKHAISEMIIIEDMPEELRNLDTSTLFTNLTSSEVKGLTKTQLIQCLNRSQIPFDEVDDILEVEGVSIHFPYSPDNCVSNNPTRLLRVQTLLKSIEYSVKKSEKGSDFNV